MFCHLIALVIQYLDQLINTALSFTFTKIIRVEGINLLREMGKMLSYEGCRMHTLYQLRKAHAIESVTD